MCNLVESMVKASSLFQQNRRIGFHGLFHLHSGRALENAEISQNCWRPTLWKRSTRMERRKTRYAWERRSSIGCKDRVQCIPESDLCIPYSQMGAYHIVGSVHTQRASVFKANGHQLQFSSDAHFGISIHPLLLVYLIARSNKQTKTSHR